MLNNVYHDKTTMLVLFDSVNIIVLKTGVCVWRQKSPCRWKVTDLHSIALHTQWKVEHVFIRRGL